MNFEIFYEHNRAKWDENKIHSEYTVTSIPIP